MNIYSIKNLTFLLSLLIPSTRKQNNFSSTTIQKARLVLAAKSREGKQLQIDTLVLVIVLSDTWRGGVLHQDVLHLPTYREKVEKILWKIVIYKKEVIIMDDLILCM